MYWLKCMLTEHPRARSLSWSFCNVIVVVATEVPRLNRWAKAYDELVVLGEPEKQGRWQMGSVDFCIGLLNKVAVVSKTKT